MKASDCLVILGGVLALACAVPIRITERDYQDIQASDLFEILKQPKSKLSANFPDPISQNLIRGSEIAIEDTIETLTNTYQFLNILLQGTGLSDAVEKSIVRATLEAQDVILQAKELIEYGGGLKTEELKDIISKTKAQLEHIAAKTIPEIELHVCSEDIDTVISVHEFLQHFLEGAKSSERFLDEALASVKTNDHSLNNALQ